MYVLPWGQMSIWGATVITSLVTVVPVVGKHILYWLWGGFVPKPSNDLLVLALLGFKKASYYGNIIMNTLLDAGKGFLKKVWDYIMNWYNLLVHTNFKDSVKMFHMLTQSAGFLTKKVSGSQRLNAEDLMWLVGFVEGDGSFSVNKNGKFFKCEFSIEVSIRDIQLLFKVKAILGGSITSRKRGNTTLARLKISSKDDLIKVICPMFDQYPMLTSKHFDYVHFRHCLFVNTSLYANLPSYKRPDTLPFQNIDSILALPYFDNWLVGFIEAEGCFSTYLPCKEKYDTSAFCISQKDGLQIMSAIKQRFRLNSNPYFNVNQQSYTLNTTSTRGIQNIINFLSKTPAKLMGYKKAQYLKWLHQIRVNPKYSKVSVPLKY